MQVTFHRHRGFVGSPDFLCDPTISVALREPALRCVTHCSKLLLCLEHSAQIKACCIHVFLRASFSAKPLLCCYTNLELWRTMNLKAVAHIGCWCNQHNGNLVLAKFWLLVFYQQAKSNIDPANIIFHTLSMILIIFDQMMLTFSAFDPLLILSIVPPTTQLFW